MKERRHILVDPEAEVAIGRLNEQREDRIDEQALFAFIGAVALIVQFIVFVGTVIRREYDFVPIPTGFYIYEWTSTAIVATMVAFIAALGSKRRAITNRKLELGAKNEPIDLKDPELITLAAQLEEVCDKALAEAGNRWGEVLAIYRLRHLGYTQLTEAEAGVPTTDRFTETLAEVEAIRAQLVRARQLRSITK